jgi:HAD superfamily hydrolase (TIGR01509 family)
VTRDLLEGIEVVVFDKDGTLIEFHRMWRGWVGTLGDELSRHTGVDVRGELYALMGVDRETGRVYPHGLLAATPMARIRDLVVEALIDEGIDKARAGEAIEAAWHAPDPVALATPVTDLRRLFDALHERGLRLAVATSDDRDPTERTLRALGLGGDFEVLACADDGHQVKPAPDSIHVIAAAMGVPPDRMLVVGDAPADLRMAAAAGVARRVGVLTGVGDRATLEPLADIVVDSIEALLPAEA